ncbi:MAG: phosphoribosylformylglycinamidine synthase subunit PurQ [Proteobacteria bacterium]|nr:phosphoribosylformylglycinamidine synthase subunit PurQ [Pseudomonadota bacterium]
MARNVRVMVLAGNGINCEIETAHACRLAGANQVDITYLWDLATGGASLKGYDLLCLPGGFLDGDDLGSARASAIRIRNTLVGEEYLFDQFKRFIESGGLTIGICNGFQLMVKLGLLPALDGNLGIQQVTLTWNDSGRFEDRWVDLAIDPKSPCVFTQGLTRIALPVRHGEGKIVPADEATKERFLDQHQVPLFYIDPETGESTTTYPLNPNGSHGGIAALTDSTGRVFGMMPHPEAFLHRTNHPAWTRLVLPEEGDGLALFVNAVDFIRKGA